MVENLKKLAHIAKQQRLGPGLVLLSFFLYPFLVNNYFIDVAFFFGIYALLGLSLNVVLGEVGLFDLGHAGFYAIGAYTTAILNTTLGIPVLVLLPLSAFTAGLFAYLVCSPVIHLIRRLFASCNHRYGGNSSPGITEQSF